MFIDRKGRSRGQRYNKPYINYLPYQFALHKHNFICSSHDKGSLQEFATCIRTYFYLTTPIPTHLCWCFNMADVCCHSRGVDDVIQHQLTDERRLLQQ